eukprot:CAMPEP_0205830666 /NCGR_PEP_ID=MMETSP0206-20130828/41767_1 /ASSEMBLY_ACC=CAM_ASM_000279 /TAXON_ID=36767 /ORGANISM="Euplotes focardii, Strain TN1" /LENGTH=485 /DNA_ID=CAMNT_0053134541 /DNA_START=29 /DNA_END=1486 /DNA_ORIENTATION=-
MFGALLGVLIVLTIGAIFFALAGKKVGTPPTKQPVWKNGSRRLGLLERWYSASHETGVMLNFCTVVSCHSTLPLRLADFQEAVACVCRTLPLLRATIVDDDASPYFEEISNFQGVEVTRVQRVTADTWERLVESENVKPFPYAKGPAPLWRVHLVDCEGSPGDFELVVTVHHGIADGRANMHICRQLLKAYARARDGSPPSSAPVPLDSDTAALPLDGLVDLRPSVGFVAKLLLAHKLGVGVPERGWLGRPAEPEARSGHVLSGEFTSDETSAIVARCRAEQVTVHALAVAASLIAAAAAEAEGSKKGGGRDTLKFGCSTAIDMRGRLAGPAPAPSTLGALVCDVKCVLPVRPDSAVWSLAREAWGAGANPTGGLQTIGVLEHAGPSLWKTVRELRAKSSAGRSAAVCVSNLGVVKFEAQYGEVHVKSARHAQLKLGEGPVFNLAMATTAGVLAYAFTYTVPNVSHEQARRFRAKFNDEVVRGAL